tara:strand:- start:327 stop:563 length:237 start_codon:yes stop_codon:yes gene_type:complete
MKGIEKEAINALRYLPADDKVSLYLKTAMAQSTDPVEDDNTSTDDAKIVALSNDIAALTKTVQSLAAQINAKGANTNP